MSRKGALSCVLAWFSVLSAQESFTPVKLTDWTAVDGVPTLGDKGTGIVIPVGGQLYRSFFSASEIALRVVSRPTFSSKPSEWASIELGLATLTFVRDEDHGGMVLLGDEQLTLPSPVSLDAEGKSAEPIEVLLNYDPKNQIATLTVGKVVLDVAVAAPAGAVELVISAGRGAAWTLENLEVKTPGAISPPLVPSQTSATVVTVSTITSAQRSAARKEALANARSLFNKNDLIAGETALAEGNSNPRNTAEWHLESANELIQAAFSLTRAGKPQTAAQLGRRALEHTDKAARKAARQPELAPLVIAAEETAGFIQEKLLADYEEAKAFYRSAAVRQPNSDGSRELRRLDRMTLEGRRKAGEIVTEEEIALSEDTTITISPPTAEEDKALSTEEKKGDTP